MMPRGQHSNDYTKRLWQVPEFACICDVNLHLFTWYFWPDLALSLPSIAQMCHYKLQKRRRMTGHWPQNVGKGCVKFDDIDEPSGLQELKLMKLNFRLNPKYLKGVFETLTYLQPIYK